MKNLPRLDDLIPLDATWRAAALALADQMTVVTNSHSANDLDGHSARVSANSMELGLEVGLAKGDVSAIGVAALLHDVGKILIDINLLNKDSYFSLEERAAVNQHAADGARILSQIDGLPEAFIDVARYHHERYDGLGYECLEGEDIPYSARIVQIADIHDALCRKRVYKPAASEGQSLCQMTRGAPSPEFGRNMFDPVLLRAFVAMRMRDPIFESTSSERASLSAYLISDPNLDVRSEARIHFQPDGTRMRDGVAFDPRLGPAQSAEPRPM